MSSKPADVRQLCTDLWRFIENVNEDTPDRTNQFFALRERYRNMLPTPVGRPRTRAHDDNNPKCSCVDCRAHRKQIKRKHTDNCGRTGTALTSSCKLNCACWCH